MDEAEGSVDWRTLREFADVELDKSFILSWHVEGGTLLIEIDAQLAEEHPFYEKPRPAEKVCIRPAVIEFPYCESIRINGVSSDESIAVIASSTLR